MGYASWFYVESKVFEPSMPEGGRLVMCLVEEDMGCPA
jgi:hypothetical protein